MYTVWTVGTCLGDSGVFGEFSRVSFERSSVRLVVVFRDIRYGFF